ncbi:MAG: HAMP domain-containing sensor histidine kinase [Erysipelotrichales bacterium]
MFFLRHLNTLEALVILSIIVIIIAYLIWRYIKKFNNQQLEHYKVDDKKQVQQAMDLIVKSLRIPALVMSEEGSLVSFNDAFEKEISDNAKKYIKSKNYIVDFINDDVENRRLERDINGKSYYIDADVIDNDLFSGVILIYNDISEILDFSLKQENFIRDIKHEINTPITAIQGLSDLLVDNKIEDPQEQRKALKTIRNEAHRMSTLVKTLSDEIKNDTIMSEVSLDEVFNDLKLIYKDTDIHMRFSNFVEQPIITNENIIKQILINLIDNAIKFTANGRITVSALHLKETINITVVDTGQGMSEDQINHIFERFYKSDKSRSNADGFGLGLSIVKNLVSKIDGRIEVDSREAKGSTFSLIIPYNIEK